MPLSIVIELSDVEVSVLEDRMLDVEDWIRGAVTNNLNISERNLIKVWLPKLGYPSVPGGKAGLIVHILNHPDYKNRAMRDAEEWQHH